MPIINITVRNKIAVNPAQDRYVCGNSDYVVHFDFDAEWDAHETKTARFVKEDGSYVDQLFSGNDCPVPVISDTYKIMVGVYAGNLSTTTAAYVPCKKSILCGGGSPADPEPDVYNQIMALLNNTKGTAKHPLTLTGAVKATYDGSEAVSVEVPDVLVVTTSVVDGKYKANYTSEKFRAAYHNNIALLVMNQVCYIFSGYESRLPKFARPAFVTNMNRIRHEYATIGTDGFITTTFNEYGIRNPQSLVFTGAVNATYDGGSHVTVNIPTGGGSGGSGGGCIVNASDLKDNNNDGFPNYGKSDKPFDEVWVAMDSGYVALHVEIAGITMCLPAVAKATEEARTIMFRDLTGTFESVILMDAEDGMIVFNSAG